MENILTKDGKNLWETWEYSEKFTSSHFDKELEQEQELDQESNQESKQETNQELDNNQDEDVKLIDEFENMNLSYDLLHGIISYGFEKPSFVQAYAIQLFNLNRDLVIQSQSGTGKTGTFIIGSLNKIDVNVNGCQVLIILPTRELARQVMLVCQDLACYMKVKVLLCVKEDRHVNYNEIKNIINRNPCVIIGTPGKIHHYMEKKIIRSDNMKCLIMDEADELLKDIFLDNIQYIVRSSGKTNICLFSATMPEQFLNMTKQFMLNPIIKTLKPEEVTLDGIKQYYIVIGNYNEKLLILKELYNKISINQAIIYVNSKKKANELKAALINDGFTISVIHGGLSTEDRNNIMSEFKSGKTRILISTDLLSRGIDIQQISLVINYELPDISQMSSYIHRIGRSGRFGRKGTAINIVHVKETYKINTIQNMYHTIINELPMNFTI